jgi:hypothetical protein
MATSNDSSVVLRLPQDLKERLQEQAERLDVSLSEVIRMKLMIAESAVHREPVIRLGDQQYRLWDLLRPDVLDYELVSSSDVAEPAAIFRPEPGRVELPLAGPVSEVVSRCVARARDEALRTGSTGIAPVHVALALLGGEECNATRIIAYLAGSPVKILRRLETEASAFPTMSRAGRRGEVPLTKQAEKVLKLVYLEAKLYRRDVADSTILLLALLRNVDGLLASVTALGVTYGAVSELLDR